MSSTHTLTGAMQDGRFVTNYAPMCTVNSAVAKGQNIPTWNSTKFREHLQSNGLALINSTFHKSPCGQAKCSFYGVQIQDGAADVSPPYTDEPEL